MTAPYPEQSVRTGALGRQARDGELLFTNGLSVATRSALEPADLLQARP